MIIPFCCAENSPRAVARAGQGPPRMYHPQSHSGDVGGHAARFPPRIRDWFDR